MAWIDKRKDRHTDREERERKEKHRHKQFQI